MAPMPAGAWGEYLNQTGLAVLAEIIVGIA